MQGLAWLRSYKSHGCDMLPPVAETRTGESGTGVPNDAHELSEPRTVDERKHLDLLQSMAAKARELELN